MSPDTSREPDGTTRNRSADRPGPLAITVLLLLGTLGLMGAQYVSSWTWQYFLGLCSICLFGLVGLAGVSRVKDSLRTPAADTLSAKPARPFTVVVLLLLSAVGLLGTYVSPPSLLDPLKWLSIFLIGAAGVAITSQPWATRSARRCVRGYRELGISGQAFLGAVCGAFGQFLWSAYFYSKPPSGSAPDAAVGIGLYWMFYFPVVALLSGFAGAVVAIAIGALMKSGVPQSGRD